MTLRLPVSKDRKLEKVRADARAYYQKNKPRARAWEKKWRKNNPKKHLELRRKSNLKRYGLTPEQFKAMVKEQGGRCKICRKKPMGRWKVLAVDHCHATGKVRALLCMRCNAMLGNVDDNLNLLRKALTYLETHA